MPPCPAPESVKAWNLLGGMEWAGLETVAEIVGICDIEGLVHDMTTIRDFQDAANG